MSAEAPEDDLAEQNDDSSAGAPEAAAAPLALLGDLSAAEPLARARVWRHAAAMFR